MFHSSINTLWCPHLIWLYLFSPLAFVSEDKIRDRMVYWRPSVPYIDQCPHTYCHIPCTLMAIPVHLWLFLYTYGHLCTLMTIPVHLRPSLYTYGHPCTLMAISVHLWPSLYTYGYPCTLMAITVHLWPSLYNVFRWPSCIGHWWTNCTDLRTKLKPSVFEAVILSLSNFVK